MNTIMAKFLKKYKKQIWFIIVVLLIIIILPSRKFINEDFKIYDYSNSIQEDKTIHFDITITKHNKIPFIYKKQDILLEIEGRKYRYVASNYPERKETYIPLKINVFNFGVLLPNKDYSEFVILFDENHHFDISNEIKFVVYPQRSKLEAYNLLEKLLNYNSYDVEQRPMY